jgi:hypothetical protein
MLRNISGGTIIGARNPVVRPEGFKNTYACRRAVVPAGLHAFLKCTQESGKSCVTGAPMGTS